MTHQTHGSDTAELSAAVTLVLALICNRLIERGVLEREQIKADLASEVETMREKDPSVLKEMILSGLAFALHESPQQNELKTSPAPNEEQAVLIEIDDVDMRLKLIGRDD